MTERFISIMFRLLRLKNEIKEYIISQIAANQVLCNRRLQALDNDKVYNTTVTWETGNQNIHVANNEINLRMMLFRATRHSKVSYAIDGGEADEFVLAYNLTVSCNNTLIKAPENMDPLLYDAKKNELPKL